MDGFVTAHLAADGVAGQYTMAYFKRDDVPFHWALADAFTICDGYHCSMLGPTWPNRLYLMTGQVDPAGVGRRPGLQQLRAGRGLLLEDLPGDAHRSRRVAGRSTRKPTTTA